MTREEAEEILLKRFGKSLVFQFAGMMLEGTKDQSDFESNQVKRENLKGAFRIDEDVKGKRILLVDDLMVSGATRRLFFSKCQLLELTLPLRERKSTSSHMLFRLPSLKVKMKR